MNRKTARDLAFKLLYQADIQKEEGEVVFEQSIVPSYLYYAIQQA